MGRTTAETRKRPNFFLVGVPCSGKTTMAKRIAEECGLQHVDITEMAIEKKLHCGYDDVYETYIMDDDRVFDELEKIFEDEHPDGGLIVDYHGCEDFLPERWFDHVILLRCNNTQLFDRYVERGYSDRKRSENLECEIMNVTADEVMETFPERMIVSLENATMKDLDENMKRIKQLVDEYKKEETS